MDLMNRHDYFYELPPERIAQEPIEPRDHSRMLVLDRSSGSLTDKHFYDLTDFLRPGDCLILNDSRVLPARLYGHRKGTGAAVELLLLTHKGTDEWEVLAGPGRKARPGDTLVFGGGLLEADVLDVINDGNRLVRFRYAGSFYPLLEQLGQMPLPHYITHQLENKERRLMEIMECEIPTAGLHLTPEMLEKVKAAGVGIGFVTLHVGLGTFRPVKADNILEHKMHAEHYELSAETAALISRAAAINARASADSEKLYGIHIETTSCRTLESVGMTDGRIQPAEGWTDIFIYPGYRFQVLDGLLTNFHLPESTLIMLVSAFAGYENTMKAYRHAVEENYRFYSFGDAMLILG